jgi:ribonuclease P protein component
MEEIITHNKPETRNVSLAHNSGIGELLFVSMKKRSDYLDLAKGLYQARPNLVIQMRPHSSLQLDRTNPLPIMVGITATKKIGGAVIRNRAKRRLRALARAAIPLWGEKDCDYVFIARGLTIDAPYASLLDDAKAALLRLSAKVKNRPYAKVGAQDKS